MNLLRKYLFDIPRDGGEGGGAGGGGGTENGGAGGGAKPWYEGKADAETVGHWQNKGYKLDDPGVIAIESTKQARELLKHFGVPAEQLMKLPKDANDVAGWDGVYQRLGVPKEAKEYDFTSVKRADGSDLDQALSDSLRSALHRGRVGKDIAPDVAKAVVKHLDDQAMAAATEATARVAAEKAALAKAWGTTVDKLKTSENMLAAIQGARRLGIDADAINAMEGKVGYAGVMEAMRKVGVGTSEDTFVEGKTAGGVHTAQGAEARKAELMADANWRQRYLAGGAAEKKEMSQLNEIITGVAA